MAFAQSPHPLSQALHGISSRPRRGQVPDETERVRLAERRQPDRRHPTLPIDLGEEPARDRAVQHLLIADRGQEQDRPRSGLAAKNDQEANAHLVGPVQVLQDEHCRLARGEPLDHAGHRFEDAT